MRTILPAFIRETLLSKTLTLLHLYHPMLGLSSYSDAIIPVLTICFTLSGFFYYGSLRLKCCSYYDASAYSTLVTTPLH